ncbi:hypothetical protein PVL29_003708 [Vitis rotundifolia]|uniref:Uncharacterized protein n=1 Tax=Vitis rotundifolia TaxID=103349 RepID=A0AA39E5H7_VITRO|nr:hypothetical protein PVL29_003708 [Vitis rotundifolia]
MKEYMNEYETIVGIAMMKVGHGSVKVRLVEASTTNASKRKRIAFGELRTSPSSNSKLRSNCCYMNLPSYLESSAYSCADHALESLCLSGEPSEVVRSNLRSVDLETTLVTELYADSAEMKSPTKTTAAKIDSGKDVVDDIVKNVPMECRYLWVHLE